MTSITRCLATASCGGSVRLQAVDSDFGAMLPQRFGVDIDFLYLYGVRIGCQLGCQRGHCRYGISGATLHASHRWDKHACISSLLADAARAASANGCHITAYRPTILVHHERATSRPSILTRS